MTGAVGGGEVAPGLSEVAPGRSEVGPGLSEVGPGRSEVATERAPVRQWFEGGLYENVYVNVDGLWKIKKLFYRAFWHGSVEEGWAFPAG